MFSITIAGGLESLDHRITANLETLKPGEVMVMLELFYGQLTENRIVAPSLDDRNKIESLCTTFDDKTISHYHYEMVVRWDATKPVIVKIDIQRL